MLDAIDKGESPTIFGDGSEAFDFVAVEDCALANICAMKSSVSDNFYNKDVIEKVFFLSLLYLLFLCHQMYF